MEPREWTLRRLVAEAALPDVNPSEIADVPVTCLTDDSRRVGSGACFAAVRGTRVDGHDFIDAAVRAGAAAVVTDRAVTLPPSVAELRVTDTRSALARLAAAYFGLNDRHTGRLLRLAGVTGTNGKSTTCHLLRSILETAGHPTALLGTIRHDLPGASLHASHTTPPPIELCELLAQAADAGASHAVMEASSHALDQHRCDGLVFDVAVFTNLTGDHGDYHHTREAYLRAKKRLFDDLDTTAFAIVNDDDPAWAELAADCTASVLRYGLNKPRLPFSGEIRSTLLSGSLILLRFGVERGRTVSLRTSLIGRHNASNILAAAGAAYGMGVEIDDIVTGVERVRTVRGRLQRVDDGEHGFSVLVDYAHTDDALVNVLSALRPLTRGRLICVFGCGGNRDPYKRPRMGDAVGRIADLAIVTSDNPRKEDPLAIIAAIVPGLTPHARCETEVQPDRRKAIVRAVVRAEPGDVVLIAGKGHEDYQIIGERSTPFDDVTVAELALREIQNSESRVQNGGGAPA